jgi:gamma-glutamylcyclotransferase (GGCT)/AIG2-like uncharacterized protein YtfP
VRPDHLAFYGTLRDFALRMRLHVEGSLAPRGMCRIPGLLYDLGAYPALMTSGIAVVHGELFKILDPRVLKTIDVYEGGGTREDSASIFVRRAVPLVEPRLLAWVYYFNGPPQGRLIASGDWMARS